MRPTLAELLPRVMKLYQRNMSSGGSEVVRSRFYKVKDMQKKFGQDDGVPVHLKAGTKDKIIFRTVFALILIGDVWGLKTVIWDASLVPFLATF